jgi:hypothetical protein
MEITQPRQHNFITQPRQRNFITQPIQRNFITQPRQRNFITQPRQHNFITQPRQYNFITQPRQHNFITQPTQHNFITQPKQHNFITVRGGAAGCLLAARLSEVPDWAVMLLEAGGEEYFLQDISSLATKLQSTAADRVYRTETSKSFFLGRTSDHRHWPRVEVL